MNNNKKETDSLLPPKTQTTTNYHQVKEEISIDINNNNNNDNFKKHYITSKKGFTGDITHYISEDYSSDQDYSKYITKEQYDYIVDKFHKHVRKFKILRRIAFYLPLFLILTLFLLPIYAGKKVGVVDMPLVFVGLGADIFVFGLTLVLIKIKNRKCFTGKIKLAQDLNQEFSNCSFRIELEKQLTKEQYNTPAVILCYPNEESSQDGSNDNGTHHHVQVTNSINEDINDSTPLLNSKQIC